MKKIIFYILSVLYLVFLYAVQALIFILAGCHWAVVTFAPLATFVLAALITGVLALLE